MARKVLENPRLPAPVGYSRAVRATGATTIWTSMTAPVAGDGSVVGPGDAHRQALVVLANIRDILEDHGSSLEDVVHVTGFVVDRSDVAAVAAAIGEMFGSAPPTVSLAGGMGLPNPAFAVELSVVAVVDG